MISANDHGFRQSAFQVGLIVNCDKMHMERKVPMKDILRPYGVPIANRHSWADYRLADWDFVGNSGQTGVAVAAVLGGNPIIVTGIDMWATGRDYFHTPVATRPNKHIMKNTTGVRKRGLKQLDYLQRFCQGANVRPMSGPLTEIFPQWAAGFNAQPALPVKYRVKHRNEPTKYVRTNKSIHFRTTGSVYSANDVVPMGTILALSVSEAGKITSCSPVLASDLQGQI